METNKNEIVTKAQTLSALELVKSMQGAQIAIVPISMRGHKIHDGMKFHVSLADYNKFLNSQQTGKISPTAAGKEFLMHTVDPEDAQLLEEILKVVGTIDTILPEVTNQISPNMQEALD